MEYNDLTAFQDHFDEIVRSAQRFSPFVRGIEFQEEQIIILSKLQEHIKVFKEEMIQANNEKAANTLLSLESMNSALISEFKMITLIKKDQPNEAWDCLVQAQMDIRTSMQTHPTGGQHLQGFVQKLHAYEIMLFPNQAFMSAGYLAEEGKCSICDAKYGECTHVKGKAYMGRLCCEIVTKADLKEISIVLEPADKRCRAISLQAGDVKRDIMTWRETK